MTSAPRVKALVTAAGLGTRLRPLTDTIPKALVPVGGRPLLDYWMDRLAAAGVQDVLINTHHLPEPIREYISRINREGHAGHSFRMQETYEPALLGSAGTVTANRSWADDADDVLIIYSDNLSGADLGDMLRFHRSHADPFTMLLFRADEPKRCGIAELDADKRIVSFIEKPEHPPLQPRQRRDLRREPGRLPRDGGHEGLRPRLPRPPALRRGACAGGSGGAITWT